MKTSYTLQILLVALLCMACSGNGQFPNKDDMPSDKFAPGRGIVVFDEYAPLKEKPIEIHYYIPETGHVPTMPILIIMPGIGRNADGYLNAWISHARKKQVMVFALQFDDQYYDTESYNRGGMFKNGELQEESTWTFSIIEPVFQRIVKDTQSTRRTFDMYGHSAGAQFVHRFLLFNNTSSVARAVTANAGWYTVPDSQVDFPFGIRNSPINTAKMRSFFEKDLILLLGTEDNNPNDSNLNTSSGAMKQGPHRYARGHYFWEESKRIALIYNYPFKWIQQDVPGVGHSHSRMAIAASDILY